jgi:hypothetical protein
MIYADGAGAGLLGCGSGMCGCSGSEGLEVEPGPFGFWVGAVGGVAMGVAGFALSPGFGGAAVGAATGTAGAPVVSGTSPMLPAEVRV